MTTTPTSHRYRLVLAIDETVYHVRPIRCEYGSDASKCYELAKNDGTVYHASRHSHGFECTCADWVYRRHRTPDPCKHVEALVAMGLMEPLR